MKKVFAVISLILACMLSAAVFSGCDNYTDYEITSTPLATRAATPDEAATAAPSIDPSAPPVPISEWDAQSIALFHANLNEATVTMNKCEFRESNGIFLYELEFVNEDMVYTYKINALNGDVIGYDRVSYFE